MSLTLYNTLSRQKEAFAPITPVDDRGRPQVRMYVCGVTVYDYCHLGHARAYVVWDLVRRYLEWKGYRVAFVQNFTDIDDKILKRAAANGESMAALAERFIEAYFEDMDRLNIKRAERYPRATEHIQTICSFIQTLQVKHFAYAVGSGDVYYSVRQFADYGQLSGRRLEDLQAGASGRVGDEEADKQDPFDFALWKSASPSEPGFDSPWGWGRPGWHIECSAMAAQTLGWNIDIHAGGSDLIFPHHENEIAQSEPITGKPMAKYWLHNGFVNINGEKMSKSLGNFTTLRTALAHYDPMALRLLFLQTHYRSPIDLTDESMIAATNGWETLSKGMLAAQEFSKNAGRFPDPITMDIFNAAMGDDFGDQFPESSNMDIFNAAMDDDFGSSGAVAVAFELAKDLIKEHNNLTHQGKTQLSLDRLLAKSQALQAITQVLGLALTEDSKFSEPTGSQLSDSQIEAQIEQRRLAKSSRNFAEADRIRAELKAQGINLIDQKEGGTRWIRE